MKAIAKLLTVCVLLSLVDSRTAPAANHGMEAIVASHVVGQAAPSTDAERRASYEQWLKLARQALAEGNFEQATKYAESAERLGVKSSSILGRNADSPEKLRREIAAAQVAPAPRCNPRNSSDDAKVRAQRALENGRNALKQGVINDAIAWRQKAVAAGATFTAGEYSPADLGRELQQAGVDPKRLLYRAPTNSSLTNPADNLSISAAQGINTPPASPLAMNAEQEIRLPQRLPPVENARPLAAPVNQSSAAKTQALRLTARAQAALDRGDINLAKQLAEQAESLRVPDNAFGQNEPRPWELLLQIDSAINRRTGVQPAANFEPMPVANSPAVYPVSQGAYNPATDRSRNVAAQNQEPTPATPPAVGGPLPGLPPLPTGPLSDPSPANPPNAAVPESPGLLLYQQGMQALEAQDRTAAMQAFREAWKHERQLPPAVRAQLKDKLSLLGQSPAAQSTNPTSEPSPLEEVSSAQHLLYQKLYREISAEEKEAEKMTATDPRGAVNRLKALRDRVSQAEVDAAAKKQLLTFVDRSITRLDQYISEHSADIDLKDRNKRVLDEIEGDRMRRFETDDKIAQLVDQFNKLMDEERFAEAEVISRQVRELAPENPISRTLQLNSKIAFRRTEQDKLRDLKEGSFYRTMTDVESSSVASVDDANPINFGNVDNWKSMSRTRLDAMRERQNRMTPAEMEIHKSLQKPVDARFTDRPLKEVIEMLGSMAGVNVVLDPAGLAAEGVTSDQPVTLNLQQPISLKSVLTLILQPLRLGYVIRNEVLNVTSEQAKDSNVFQKVYYVADLVVPIPNFVPGYDMGLPAAIREAHQALGYGGGFQPASTSPLAFAQNSPSAASTNPSVLSQYVAESQYANRDKLGMRPTTPTGLAPGSMGGAALADFDTLIELITSTIAPDTWADGGGSGAIEPFPTNLSLVISQTQDVHDQIADLLEQLRRLQDLQVAIEVKFIRLSDQFFERIGVDFDFQIDDNVLALRRDDQGPSMAIGLDPISGDPTPDLDIPFTQESFALAVPPFGGFANTTPAGIGIAILSDIEAFFLVQASTADRRSNVMQAPKVTLFNGQAASVADTSQRPFVVSLIPVVGDFAAAHQPVITVLNEGTQLGVQAVVSSDRRFVRLTLVPFFSQIGEVQTFTFSGTSTSDSGTNVVDANGKATGEKNNTKSESTGTTVQLPTFSFTTVSTTVSVPDGGTVLLGGIKRLSEGRNEAGVPMLNTLPYINRLFKNVGIGRETTSLMLMVTPRIIIQEEEEERLGIDLNQ